MDDDVDTKLSTEHEQDVQLHHVILPRDLPQKMLPNLYGTEIDLMLNMVQTVQSLVKLISPKTVEYCFNVYNELL